MNKKRIMVSFILIFLVSVSLLYLYDYYKVRTATCCPPEEKLKSRYFYIDALTASGSIYKERENNKTFDYSAKNNAIITIHRESNNEYSITLRVGGTVLIREKATRSGAELFVFNGSDRGKYESVGDNFLLWLRDCYSTPVMERLGLTLTPKYLGENLKISPPTVHRYMVTIWEIHNETGIPNATRIHKKYVIRDAMDVEGPSIIITDPTSNFVDNASYYSGTFLPCGIPVDLQLIVPVKYVNMTGLEGLIGYKPRYSKYIRYYHLSWSTNWSQIEHIKCKRPLFFSDIQVAALSVVAGLIGVLVIWVLKRGS